jgi:S1-C subfamily serine protease
LAQRYKLPVSSGAYLSSVSSDSAADKAGLEVGDIITKVDDTTITSASDLMIAIRKKDPGDTITVTYNRSGQEKTATVELDSDTSAQSTANSILRQGSSSSDI